ncbi:MAG: Tat pathway signal protein [Actinomycetota bacterium]|nr:Tat pathway signal protein [Actinomycetota bacterium]
MTQPLPVDVRNALAQRVYRMQHYLWFELRDYWSIYPQDAQEKIRALGWEPPRPAIDEQQVEIVDNNSGEDFLYMHCEWLAFANHLLAATGEPEFPRVEGWTSIPAPDDPDFPVPAAWFGPESFAVSNAFIVRAKTDDFFERRFRRWEQLCSDPSYLRRVTLGELGTFVEATLHDAVRSRWGEPPAAMRPDPPPPGEPLGDNWDDPGYDFLRDHYAMHVNPIYWKFYGWVLDRVEDWKITNGVFGRDFWKATWIGKMPAEHQPAGQCPPSPRTPQPVLAALGDPEIGAAHLAEMEQVVDIIAEAMARDG